MIFVDVQLGFGSEIGLLESELLVVRTPKTCCKKMEMMTVTLLLEKQLQSRIATAFCSSTVRLSKSFGYFISCLSFLSSCRKDQKSGLESEKYLILKAIIKTNIELLVNFKIF